MKNPWMSPAQRPDRNDWTTGALCAEADPELWFSDHKDHKAEVARICARCPIRPACSAAHKDAKFGVWGGFDRKKNRDLLGGAA